MTPANLVALAKQGDPKAIAAYLNDSLQSIGITAKASHKDICLEVILETDRPLNQEKCVAFLRNAISSLQLESIKQVKVCGRRTGEDFPAWEQEFQLEKQFELPVSAPDTAVMEELLLTFGGDTEGNKDSSESGIVSIPSEPKTELVKLEKTSFWESVVGTVSGAAGSVRGAVAQAGGAVAGTALGAAGKVRDAATQASQAVVGAAVGAGGAIGSATVQATQIAGQAIAIVGNNPPLRKAIKSLNQDWLLSLIDQVDIVKAETAVKTLQQQHPAEQPAQISHRFMLEKAIYAGGTGLASSLAPGQAAAMFAVDWFTTTALSAELVYQIAAAYGLDLKDPARKGETLAIFGLAFGGSRAIKAGLGLLRNVPVAGAVIGASSNAVMIYALGYAACRFYEAQQKPLILEAKLADAQAETEKYLDAAISQQKIMDRILVHIVLAGNPGRSWEDVVPELQAANLSAVSLEAIAADIKSPQPLETLLPQLNRDFAVAVLAQCHKIAQLDEKITSEEAKVIEAISKNFNIELDNIKEQLKLVG